MTPKTESGQTAIEFLLAAMVVLPALVLLLALSFHLTGWLWSRYWSYQSLHCLFEENTAQTDCLAKLREKFRFHPGEQTASVRRLRRTSDRATLVWSYQLDLGVKTWTLEKTWTLKEPKPAAGRQRAVSF